MAPALAFTRRKLEEFGRMLTSRGVEVTYGTEEFGSLDGPPPFTFPCPSCREALGAYPSLPWDMPREEPNLLGFVTFMHEDDYSQCGRGVEDFTMAVAGRYGVKAPAGVDLELVRLKRAMAGGRVEWLIPGVMERGTLAALFGPPGTGKSLLALEWAAQVALAGKRVVYLDEENPVELMDERLEAMGMDPASLPGLTYHSFPGWAADTEEGAARILEACAGADLVVFDSWAKFFLAASQNDDAAANRAYRLVVKPLRAASVGILRLDHTGHEEVTRPSGTVAKLADVDHNWQIKAKALDGLRADVTLVHRKSRTARGPKSINLIREVGPLRHVDTQDRPAGQVEDPTAPVEKVAALVAFMDEKGWPTDWTLATVQEELKKAGRPARKADVADAVRTRRTAAPPAV